MTTSVPARLLAVWHRTPVWLRGILLPAVLMFDAYLGLEHGNGVLNHTGLDGQDIAWILQFIQFNFAALYLLSLAHRNLPRRASRPLTLLAPLLAVLVIAYSLEFLLGGKGELASINYNITSVIVVGLFWAAVYLTIAAGLTLTYKVQKYGNFAQAELMLLGAYIAFTVQWSDRFFEQVDAPVDEILSWEVLFWGCLAAFVLTGLAGVITDRLVYRRFRLRESSPQTMMIASLGIALVIRAMIYLRFSPLTFLFVPDRDWRLSTSKFEVDTGILRIRLGERSGIDIFEWVTTKTNGDDYVYGLTYGRTAVIVGVFGSVLLLMLLLKLSRLGREMRAVADNPDLAASSGINVERVHTYSAFISAGLSGFGGALIAMVLRINPEAGLEYLLPAFAVVVLGTIGSISGVIIAALVVGFVRSLSEPVLMGVGNELGRATYSSAGSIVPYIFMILVLLFMPKGIGDGLERWHIRRLRMRAEAGKRPLITYLEPVSLRLSAARLWLTASINGTIEQMRSRSTTALERLQPLKSRLSTLSRSSMESVEQRIDLLLERIPDSLSKPRAMWRERLPYGREQSLGSWMVFAILLGVLVLVSINLPSVTEFTKTMQIARLVVLVSIFALMAFSLNLHTGVTGMTNFGVIFFVGIGAVSVGLMPAGYAWDPLASLLLGVCLAALAGWMLAYPTARLRMDYFAIVTISLGEILRILLVAEPLLRAGTSGRAAGIDNFELPFEGWWESTGASMAAGWLGLDQDAPYVLLLAVMALASALLTWLLLDIMLSSPWGRILRGIREDEEVVQHHGHDVFHHKAASLALGAGVAGLAGGLWAWLNAIIFPDFMNPARSTFLVWAAFVVGGRGNNKGMVIGAFIIVLTEFLFNVMVVARGDSSMAFHQFVGDIDQALVWIAEDLMVAMSDVDIALLMLRIVIAAWLLTIVVKLLTKSEWKIVGDLALLGVFVFSIATISSQTAIDEAFPSGSITAELAYVKLALIGLVIVLSLLISRKGLLPEVPNRPERPLVKDAGGENE